MTSAARPVDFAVVGAGLAGASTARVLVDRGHEVTVLERGVPANPLGSSHGSARILRHTYPDPFYTELVGRASDAWTELAATAGVALLTPTGAVDFGAIRDPHALSRVLADCGVAHELLPPAAAAERWPGITFDTDVLYHSGAGVIDAENAVLAMLRLACEGGARLHTDWIVSSIERGLDGFVLTSAGGEQVAARGVVLTAGGWLPDLLAELPAHALFRRLPPLVVRQEQVFHYPYRAGAPGDASWPSFVYKGAYSGAAMFAYGLPGGRDAEHRGQKVAEFNAGPALRSAADADGVVNPANRERVTRWVERTLPGLVAQPYAESTCLFTNTPSEDFVVDSAEGITIVSPCSGHGAKFAPLIGHWAADAAAGSPSVPARFRVGLHG